MEIPLRGQVPESETWDLSRIFKSVSDWQAACDQLDQEVEQVGDLEADFTASGRQLYKNLTQIFDLDRRVSKVYAYAGLASDVDTSDKFLLGVSAKAQQLAASYQASVSFISPALLALGEEKLEAFLSRRAAAGKLPPLSGPDHA